MIFHWRFLIPSSQVAFPGLSCVALQQLTCININNITEDDKDLHLYLHGWRLQFWKGLAVQREQCLQCALWLFQNTM